MQQADWSDELHMNRCHTATKFHAVDRPACQLPTGSVVPVLHADHDEPMTGMEAGAPGVLCLQSLRIAGLRHNVLASLIVTASWQAADTPFEQPLALFSSLAALIPAGASPPDWASLVSGAV